MRSQVGVLVLVLSAWGCASSGTAVPPYEDAGQKDASHVEVGYPCTTDDECTSLDDGIYCNGVPTCDNGICRVVAPPTCDDGIACTDDVCDLATDSCQNIPNNDKCPTDFPICFVQYGCQAAQPCEHDSECDDGLWCNGTESCIQGHCTTSLAPDCDDHDPCTIDACDEATDSCTHTHQQLTGVTDHPDHDFVDANCDGIDGDIAKSIFVAPPPVGSDTNPGTMASPVATIAKGIELATAQKLDVLIAIGTYSETVTMVAGVSLYGGYDSTDSWKRYHYTPMAATIIMGGVTAVKFQGIAEQTELQLVAVASAKPFTSGTSSVGISVVTSTGPILLTDCVVVAGNGSDGTNASDGTTGQTGGGGGNASGTTRGGQGSSPCGALGGYGATSVSGATPGNQGDTGTTVAGGGTGQTGGSGGGAGTCNTTSASNGEPAPPVGQALQAAGNGPPGNNGGPGAAFGTLDTAGNYSQPAGNDGLASGHPGGGGAGGGSGGGSAYGTPGSACTNCNGLSSGAGGGGGGGGCGGTPGHGGGGGGASFGIVVVNSVATITGCKLTSGLGGTGGAGGVGGQGGSGATGGNGAGGQCGGGSWPCNSYCGGAGHAGGQGGTGGQGGGGAGGTGGASVCIVYKGTAPTTAANTCVNGGGGSGGAGGSNGAASAPAGTAGVTADVRSG